MFSTFTAIFCFVFFISQTTGLVELPKVADNSILLTEAAIRKTVNSLFYSLRLRNIKTKPRLKEYSTVHNNLISYTLQDSINLKEIAKLTRVDKKKINNETANFMTVINELLNEDIDVEKMEPADVNDGKIIEYIDNFLTTLDNLKEAYGVNKKIYQINEDVYKILDDKEVAAYNYTIDDERLSEFGDNDTILDESDYWKPKPSTRRIYHGSKIDIKHFPFMASIQLFNRFHCAGSIIKNDLIITASSCLQLAWNNRFFRENPAFLSVRVGSEFYNGGGENIPVLEVYFHPEYNPKNLWHNLCLLRLIRKLRFRKTQPSKVKMIDIDTRANVLPTTTNGITIIGWGARTMSNRVQNPWANQLAYAVLDYYPLRECQDIYSKTYVTRKHFCAGFFSKGGGACNRDVGGPGVINGILVGVVSFGSPVCGTIDAPTVFTKIGFYVDWIETIMEMDVRHLRQPTTSATTLNFHTFGHNYKEVVTTFKIPPLSGKIEPIPISEVDALRMLANGKLFKEFLNTLFHDKELGDYQELFKDIVTEKPKPSKPVPKEARINLVKVPEQLPSPIESLDFGGDQGATTEMGMVDPDENGAVNIHQEEFIPIHTEPFLEAEQKEDIATLDNNLEEMVKIDRKISELVQADDDKPEPVVVNTNIERDSNKNKFEKDLVNLIDDKDLKEIIETMPSVEEDKLAVDEKVIQLFNKKEKQDKMSNLDDSILTLLYLSDSEKGNNQTDEFNLIQDYVNDADNVMEIKDDDADDDDDDDDVNALSIEARPFRQMAFRSALEANTSTTTDLVGLLTREELDKILTKQIQALYTNLTNS